MKANNESSNGLLALRYKTSMYMVYSSFLYSLCIYSFFFTTHYPHHKWVLFRIMFLTMTDDESTMPNVIVRYTLRLCSGANTTSWPSTRLMQIPCTCVQFVWTRIPCQPFDSGANGSVLQRLLQLKWLQEALGILWSKYQFHTKPWFYGLFEK